jgi:hypothetical protein
MEQEIENAAIYTRHLDKNALVQSAFQNVCH